MSLVRVFEGMMHVGATLVGIARLARSLDLQEASRSRGRGPRHGGRWS